jgi:mRNA interferase MazF
VICRQYDIVVVPFPLTDRRASKRRPALALSTAEFSAEAGHTVLAMITSADNPDWPLDVLIDSARAGLRAASKVRMKLFTLDNRVIRQTVGTLNDVDQRAVAQAMKQLLGASS